MNRQTICSSIAALACGCIGSANPVVEEGGTGYDPRLLGTWGESASVERAVITQRGPRSYSIQYTDGAGQTILLDGMLGRRQRRYILDVQPAPSALGAYKDLVVRLHIPLTLDTVSDRVRVATLDPDALDKYLRDNPGAIAHGRTHDGLMLTADSPAVARFLSMYLQRPGVLTSPSTWTRRAER